jgi:polyhydroxyalkanoate synthesis regulator phasin
MAIDGVTAGAAAYTAPMTTAAAKETAQGASGGTTTAPAAPTASDSVTLSPLAGTLRGAALDLFNTLDGNDRQALSDLVDKGRMSAEDVQNALKDRLKQARNAAWWDSNRMFERENAAVTRIDRVATADEITQAVTSHLDRRKQLIGRLEELSKDGKTGGEEYADIVRTLAGQKKPGEAEPAYPTFDESTRRARREGRGGIPINTPFIRSLVDPRFNRTGAEKFAGETLSAQGFASASFDRVVRARAEEDVAAMVTENARWLADVKSGNHREPPRPPADPDFDVNDVVGRVT